MSLSITMLHEFLPMRRFGMAEQAVNTIYLLGEQPDALCTTLLQNFTFRAFTPLAKADEKPAGDATQSMEENREEPDTNGGSQAPPSPSKTEVTERADQPREMGDSFILSQLLFLVGHVAIKHIVYLELVERDLKRRKDEGAKGKQFGRLFVFVN